MRSPPSITGLSGLPGVLREERQERLAIGDAGDTTGYGTRSGNPKENKNEANKSADWRRIESPFCSTQKKPDLDERKHVTTKHERGLAGNKDS